MRTIHPYNQSLSRSSFSQSTFVDLSLPIESSLATAPQPFELDLNPEDGVEESQEFEGTWTANLRARDEQQLDLVDSPTVDPTTETLLNPEPLAIVSLILTTLIGIFLRKSSNAEK